MEKCNCVIKYNNLCLIDISKKQNINIMTVRKRYQRGWTEEQILSGQKERGYLISHNGKKQTLKKWSLETGLSVNVLRRRLRDSYSITDILKVKKNVKSKQNIRVNQKITNQITENK